MSESFWTTSLPAVNACFNALSASLLLVGWLAIREKNVGLHLTAMLGALISSSLFLVGYLARMAVTGTHHFEGTPAMRVVYLTILFSHMILAVALLPLLAVVLWRAAHKQFALHKRIARVAWPVWMYVSVTGVVVYCMLYR